MFLMAVSLIVYDTHTVLYHITDFQAKYILIFVLKTYENMPLDAQP